MTPTSTDFDCHPSAYFGRKPCGHNCVHGLKLVAPCRDNGGGDTGHHRI